MRRAEAARWAADRYPAPPRPGPFVGHPLSWVAEDALAALACADLSTDLEMQVMGEPYFIRRHDLLERSLALQEKDWIGKHPRALRPKRLHRMRPAGVVAARLRISADRATEMLEVNSLRGLDALDYYEQILFDDRQGRQVLLTWYLREPVRDGELRIEESVDADGVISSFLRLLGCGEEIVSWRPGRQSGEAV